MGSTDPLSRYPDVRSFHLECLGLRTFPFPRRGSAEAGRSSELRPPPTSTEIDFCFHYAHSDSWDEDRTANKQRDHFGKTSIGVEKSDIFFVVLYSAKLEVIFRASACFVRRSGAVCMRRGSFRLEHVVDMLYSGLTLLYRLPCWNYKGLDAQHRTSNPINVLDPKNPIKSS